MLESIVHVDIHAGETIDAMVLQSGAKDREEVINRALVHYKRHLDEENQSSSED